MFPCSDIYGFSWLAGVFSIDASSVGVNGVKPVLKVVSARLDTHEETRSDPQRVSHLCVRVCVNAAGQEAN